MTALLRFFNLIQSCPKGRIFFPAMLFMVLVSCSNFANADFKISPESWVIGSVNEGDKLSLEVTIANTTSETQLLKRVFHSCDCLNVAYTPATLSPRESTKLQLSLSIINLPKAFEFLLFIEGDKLQVQTFVISGQILRGGREKVYEPIPENSSGKALVIHFFFSQSCSGCDEIIAGPVRKVLDEFEERVGFVSYNMSDPKGRMLNYRLMRSFEDKFGVSKYAPVEVFIGSKVLIGKKQVLTSLYDTVVAELDSYGNELTNPSSDDSLYENISISGAILYGLIDGLNPCVFAGLILFLSYLLASGLSGSRLLQVGLTYCSAVFITYFAIGFAIFSFFYGTSAYPLIKKGLIWFSIIIALAGAVASFRDAFVAYKGDVSKVWLKLPNSLKEFSAKLIRSKKGRFTVLLSTFFLGVILTVIEGACSGIQYIPACAMMVTVGESVNQSLFGILLLTIYNLAFILPLLVLLVFVLTGRKFSAYKKLQTKNVLYARIGTGVLLVVVAVSIFLLS